MTFTARIVALLPRSLALLGVSLFWGRGRGLVMIIGKSVWVSVLRGVLLDPHDTTPWTGIPGVVPSVLISLYVS